MKLPTPGPLLLRVRLAAMRLGWANAGVWAAGALSIAAGLWSLAHLSRQADAPLAAVRRAEAAMRQSSTEGADVRQAVSQERLRAYYEVLGDSRLAEQQVRQLFAIAALHGLALTQAEYKTAYDSASRTTSYQVTMPIRGPYEALRRFSEQTLRTIPFASLDEISFKRDAIGNNELEVRLRFTLYLADGALKAEMMRPQLQAGGGLPHPVGGPRP